MFWQVMRYHDSQFLSEGYAVQHIGIIIHGSSPGTTTSHVRRKFGICLKNVGIKWSFAKKIRTKPERFCEADIQF
jgi:hypothetical protein